MTRQLSTLEELNFESVPFKTIQNSYQYQFGIQDGHLLRDKNFSTSSSDAMTTDPKQIPSEAKERNGSEGDC